MHLSSAWRVPCESSAVLASASVWRIGVIDFSGLENTCASLSFYDMDAVQSQWLAGVMFMMLTYFSMASCQSTGKCFMLALINFDEVYNNVTELCTLRMPPSSLRQGRLTTDWSSTDDSYGH